MFNLDRSSFLCLECLKTFPSYYHRIHCVHLETTETFPEGKIQEGRGARGVLTSVSNHVFLEHA